MADYLQSIREKVEIDGENCSGGELSTETQIEPYNSDELKEMNGGMSLGSSAVKVNESVCGDDVPKCMSSQQSKCTERDLTEHEQNAHLPEEALLQEPPEDIGAKILEIVPEDPISPVTTQPMVRLEEETAVNETAEIEIQNESPRPMETGDDQMQAESVLPTVDTFKIGGNNDTETTVSETNEIKTQNESTEPLEANADKMQAESVLPTANATVFASTIDGNNDAEITVSETNEFETRNDSTEPFEANDERMRTEPVLPTADVTDNEVNASEDGGNNEIEASGDLPDVEKPSSHKEFVTSEESDSEGKFLSVTDAHSTSKPNHRTSSLGDEALPEPMIQENFNGSSVLDTPVVSSIAVSLNVHENSVFGIEEATISQHNGFPETVDSCQMAAVDDKDAGESFCGNPTKESEIIDDLDASESSCAVVTKESNIEDLRTYEDICEDAVNQSNTEELNGDVEQPSANLEPGQDSSDCTESVDRLEPSVDRLESSVDRLEPSVDRLEPDAGDNDNGCDGKFVEDERPESIDLFSKLDAEIAKTSDASNDTIHMNEDALDHSLKSDDSLNISVLKNSDDTFKEDCTSRSTSDGKLNHLETAGVSLIGNVDSGNKKVSELSDNSTEKTPSKSASNKNEVAIDIKEELDRKSITNDKTKTATGALQTPKSGASGNRAQQKTGKNAQASKGTKQQECIVCKKVTKCKYNIVRNDDTKHLCDDKCFQLFRTQPTTYLQTDSKKPGASATELCSQCQKAVPANAKGKNSLKVDKELKKFCSTTCLNAFKKAMKTCANCGKDLRNDAGAVAAPIEGEGTKDFCCHACLVKYEHSKRQETKIEVDDDDDDEVEIVDTMPAPKTKATSARNLAVGKSKCSVCSKLAIVRQEANFKGVTYKLCGDACLSAFRIMHHLSVNRCEDCNGMYGMDDVHVQTIQFEGLSMTFCSERCLSNFKTKRQRVVPCIWCNTKKSNFDMVERLDANGKFQMFCSLNCLSLYRVNLQANSNQSVACDQCRKCIPALYHLTMSDASVRNFCGYTCVMAFQAQFSQPSTTSGELPIPGDQVTANAANTQPAQSAVPPSQPARNSPYGTRNSSRAAKSATSLSSISQMQSSTMPVISNIVSLAAGSSMSPASHHADNTNASTKPFAHIGVQTVAPQEIVVQPALPKQVKNKALLCKPFMLTKATSCRPHTVMKGSQTEENWEPKKVIVPCPVPTITPAPMMMYSSPVPYPILIPIPVPIPIFIPTTKKSTAGIMKKIKELQERVPSDPFQAELLMMAEAVANANKAVNSDSESEDDDADGGGGSVHVEAAENSANLPAHNAQGINGELAEDMLQMALRMAEMQNEQTLDLEDAVDPTPIRTRERIAQLPMQAFDSIAADADILHASHVVSTPRGRGRGKRRGGSRGGRGGSSSAKKPRVDEEPVEQASAPATAPSIITEPPADANCILKFTYGINAYKHWAIQKNAHLERVAPPKAGMRQRLFKLDLLQCSADELNYALCLFVKEVRKPNGEEYAPDSIYYLCLGIQEYLYENCRIDNIFTDFFYEKFTDCLNEVLGLYEVRLNAQGMLVCRIEEEHLWEAKQLGAHSPHVLLNTLVYFNTRHFMLRTPEDHLGLSFSHIMKHWKKTSTPSGKPGRSVYLRYYAPSQLGSDAAQKRKKEDLPVFEQAENADNPLRCPVKLYEFYLSKCPESIKNRSDVFYLVPERSCVPDSPVWYSTVSLGLEGMTRMLNRLRVVREVQESQLTSLAVPYYN